MLHRLRTIDNSVRNVSRCVTTRLIRTRASMLIALSSFLFQVSSRRGLVLRTNVPHNGHASSAKVHGFVRDEAIRCANDDLNGDAAAIVATFAKPRITTRDKKRLDSQTVLVLRRENNGDPFRGKQRRLWQRSALTMPRSLSFKLIGMYEKKIFVSRGRDGIIHSSRSRRKRIARHCREPLTNLRIVGAASDVHNAVAKLGLRARNLRFDGVRSRGCFSSRIKAAMNSAPRIAVSLRGIPLCSCSSSVSPLAG